jgi:hypothetical protein
MTPKINDWAPWMLKFCYQYIEKCNRESSALQANAAAIAASMIGPQPIDVIQPTSPVTPKGSYLYVYGEDNESREITWNIRAQNTFNELQSVLRLLGAQPEVLIPADAFEEVVPEDIPPELIAIDDVPRTGDLTTAGFSDAMTDEEFARFLQQNSDDLD